MGTQVSDVAPLAGMSALQTLNISNTHVTDLAPLAGLSALQTLDISGTQVTDLSELFSLITPARPVRWSSYSFERPGIYVKLIFYTMISEAPRCQRLSASEKV